MYEGRGHNDTSSKISSKEVNVEWDAEPWYAFCQDRKEGCEAGGDHDDEQGRDSGSELTIVFILRRVERTDDLS